MAVLTDIKQERKKRSRIRLIKRLIVLVLVCGLTIAAIYSKELFAGIDIPALMQEAFGTVGKTGSYPVSLVGETGSAICNMGGSAAVLTDSNVQIYSRAGRRSGTMQNGFANPVLKVNGNRGILYARGDKTIKTLGKGGLLNTQDLEGLVYTAELAADGQMAVATQAQRRAAKVEVFDSAFNSLFTWLSAENQVLSLALSPDTQKLAVGTITARDGAILSAVNLFSIPEKSELGKVEFFETLLVALKYTANGVQVLGDNQTVFIDNAGETKGNYAYGGKPLAMYSTTGNSTALILGEYKRDRQVTVVSLSEQCNVNFSFVIKEHVRDVYTDGENTYILTDANLYIYNGQGQCTQTIANENGDAVMASGADVYLLMPHEVAKVV